MSLADEIIAKTKAALPTNEVQGPTHDVAEQAAGYMRSIVPVDTGELRASIGVRRRGIGYVVEATADHAEYVNNGTSDTPEFAFRERTEDHFRGA